MRAKPRRAGKNNPGAKKTSTKIKQNPTRNKRSSSWPARPATYFDPKKI